MKSVLLVTSHVDEVITISNMLRKKGYFIIPATDVESARTFLARMGRVDAVIARYEARDFADLMTALKSEHAGSLPVIALSDRASVSEYLAAMSAGVFEFLFWPVREAEFARVVDAAVRKNAGRVRSDRLPGSTVETGRFPAETNSFLFHG